MKITTRLTLNALLPAVLALAVLSGILLMNRDIGKAQAQVSSVTGIKDGILELNLLTSAYLLEPSRYNQEFWFDHFHDSAAALYQMEFRDPVRRELMLRIRQNYANLATLFSQLVAFHTGQRPGVSPARLSPVEQRIVQELRINDRFISSDITRLTTETHNNLSRKLRLGTILIAFFTVLMAGAVICTQLKINGRIKNAIERLRKGTDRIASGDLDYKVGTTAADEIGELGRAFDRMARQLKLTLVSRDELRREIEERMRVEDELRTSEENYRAIFDSVNDAVFVHDIETGNVVSVNSRTEEMYGRSAEEFRDFSSENLFTGVPGYTAQEALQRIRRAAAGEPQLFEWLSKKKTGELFWVEVNLKRAAIGGETRLLAVVRDISDRKRTEEALNLTQFSVDHASVSAFLMAKDARFLYVNEQTCRNLGYAREELLRMTVADIDPEIRLPAWPARWEQIKREGSIRFERMHRKKDGTLMPVEITANFVAFGGKEYNWAFAVDMTGKKLAEQKLQESEERFRQLAENTEQVFWFMRPEPEQVLYVSPAVERIWGVPAEDMYSDPRLWTRMIHPDDRDAVERAFADWLAGRSSGFDQEYRIVRSDGGVRWIRDRGTLIRDSRGRVVRASGIADDITGRKKAEQEIRRAKELLEEAQQIAGIGNWEWDRRTDRVTWSTELHRIFKVPPGEFEGTFEAFMQKVHPDDRHRIEEHNAETISRRKERSANEYRIIRPDGTIRILYTRSIFEYDKSGKLLGARGTAQDVTEPRRAEESLKLVQFSMDHASVAAFIIGRDGGIMYANEQASRGLGYSRQELTSMTIPDLDPNFPASKWGAHWEELKKKGFLHFESAHRRKDGKLVPMDISVNYLSFGGREYNVGFALDINERKQAEDSLKQSFKLTETILDSINDPISLIDVRDFTLVRVNKVFLQRYGYSDQSEIRGKHCYEITHHRSDVCSPPHDICPLIETVKTQDHFAADHVHYDSHGEKVYVEVSTSPVRDQAGNVTQVVHVQRDITERKKAEEALRLSEARFRNLFRQSSLSMQILSPDGASIEVNRAFEQLWEVNADALKDYNILQDEQLVSLGVMGYIRKAFAGEATEIPVTRYDPGAVSPGSRTRWVKGFIYPVAAGPGAIHDLVLMHVDVSDMVKAEEALRESEERFRAFFESAAVGAVELDPDTRRFLRVNDRFCEITGYSREELLSKTVPDITHPQDRQPDSTAFARARAGMIREHKVEKRYVCKDGRSVWVQVSGSIIRDVHGRPVWAAGVIQDITERKRMEDEIRHLAHHDALTGLPNRRLFVQILNVELALTKRHGNRLAVLFLDLDRFKEINDRHGHAIGDELLKTVAKRLRTIIRGSDTVARIGGDEFNIVLTNLSRPDNISEIAMKITDSFREAVVVDGHELAVTTSVGISIYPDDSGDLDTLIQYADAAMYAAKESGRNRFKFYNPTIDVRSAERARFESYLRHTIERDELFLEYQPQIDTSTGTIVSVEALVRWKHPELGLLEPGKFLEAAAETGYITEIDQWVLRTACSQVKAWRDAGLARFSLTVNLSARQFDSPELAATVIRILDESGMPPDCLTLEIGESTLMGDIERTAAHLKELTRQGVHISVDDFGTGRSSLSHLKRLPIERVKIDRSFTRDITTDPEDRAVINAMTAMARSLRIRVIAGGVETEDQRAFLKKAGCEEMQGYLFGRPLSAAEMTDSMTKKA